MYYGFRLVRLREEQREFAEHFRVFVSAEGVGLGLGGSCQGSWGWGAAAEDDTKRPLQGLLGAFGP